jgi:hypothetical protein
VLVQETCGLDPACQYIQWRRLYCNNTNAWLAAAIAVSAAGLLLYAAAYFWCSLRQQARTVAQLYGPAVELFTDFPVYEQCVAHLSILQQGVCQLGLHLLFLQSVRFAQGSCLFVTVNLWHGASYQPPLAMLLPVVTARASRAALDYLCVRNGSSRARARLQWSWYNLTGMGGMHQVGGA